MSLEKEALQYADGNEWNSLTINAFIAGAQSKHVQAEIIKAQIIENDVILKMLETHGTSESRLRVEFRIEELKQQLKSLKD